MKKLLLATLLFLFVGGVNAQENEKVDALIREGIQLYDQGDYQGSLKKYNEALKIEEHNVFALAEKAMAQLALKDYEKAISTCRLAIEKHPGDPSLKYVYTTYGTSLDHLGKPEEAVMAYNEGIESFPKDNQLHFNKGITETRLEKWDDAEKSFQQSAKSKSTHASSHNALGRVSMVQNNKIPALLALCRFMSLEPTGPRAQANLPIIEDLMGGSVTKNGKRSITINLDSDLVDAASDSTEKKPNDFSNTELTLSFASVLDFDKKNKKKNKAELFFDKMETVCGVMSETKEDNFGFFWEYYAPFFIEMKEKKQLETFSYLVYASTNDKDIKKWIEKNSSKVEDFIKWSVHYEH